MYGRTFMDAQVHVSQNSANQKKFNEIHSFRESDTGMRLNVRMSGITSGFTTETCAFQVARI